MAYKLHRPKGEQRLDANGVPFNGGVFSYKRRGTETALTVYKDDAGATAWGTSVTLDSAGRLTDPIFVGEDDFKETFTPPAGSGEAPITYDGYQGADPVPVTPEFVSPLLTVITESGSRAIGSSDWGKLIRANSSGGTIVLTLPPVSGVTNGKPLSVVHDGSANSVVIACSGSDLVGGKATLVLRRKGEAVMIVAGLSGYDIAERMYATPQIDRMPAFTVADRLTSPPASPDAGACYIANGAPTGVWSAIGAQQHDVLEASGIGTWIIHRPFADCGWLAYVVDEDLVTQYRSSGWSDWTNVTTPASSELGTAIFEERAAAGSGVAALTASAWTKRPLTHTTLNDISGASLSSSVITLAAGKYLIKAWQSFYFSGSASTSGSFKTRLADTTNSTYYYGASSFHQNSNAANDPEQQQSFVFAVVDIATTTTFELQYFQNYGTTSAAGIPVTSGSTPEVYAQVAIVSLSALQGPQGLQGLQGSAGAGYAATSSTSRTIASTGTLSFTTQSGLAYSSGARVRVTDQASASNYMEGVCSSYSGTTLTIVVDLAGGAGTIAAWNINVSGERGATYTAGSLSGNTGVSDNRMLRSDGTSGTGIQNSQIGVSDTGGLSAVTEIMWQSGGTDRVKQSTPDQNVTQFLGQGNSKTTSIHINPGAGTVATDTVAELVVQRTADQAFGGNYGRISLSAIGSAYGNVDYLHAEYGGTVTPIRLDVGIGIENPASTFLSINFLSMFYTSGGSESSQQGAVGFGNDSLTTQRNIVSLLRAPLGTTGQRDSHAILWEAKANDGTERAIWWRQYTDVTSNAGASSFVWQSNLNGAGWTTRMTLTDGGVLTPGGISATTIVNTTIGASNTITAADSNFTLQDNVDATKQAQFQLSGISTGTTRTFTLPNASGTIALLSDITGGQISFPATQNASSDANTLDDYEEGSWTPTFGGFSSAPSGGSATYVKVGKIVMCSVNGWASGTSNATTKTITLPFASEYATVMSGVGHGMDNTAFLNDPCRIDTRAGSTTADVYKNLNADAWTNSGACTFDFTITYRAAA